MLGHLWAPSKKGKGWLWWHELKWAVGGLFRASPCTLLYNNSRSQGVGERIKNVFVRLSVCLPSEGYRPYQIYSFLFFQNSTRQSRVLEIWQTKAVRISCCFSFQSSVNRARGLGSPMMPALSPPTRRCVATGSNGGPHPSKSCTRPTTGKRTPARKRGRP